MRRNILLATPAAALVLAATAACGGGSSGDTAAAVPSGSSGGVLSAAGCPSTLGIQLSWYPEAEYGGMYNIIGPNGTFDAKKGIYSGEVGGVKVEVRAGGPLTGNQQVTTQLYTDDSLFIGLLASDESIQNSAKQPTEAVMNYFDKDPQVLLYDPSVYHFSSIADIGRTKASVLFFDGSTYMDYLTGTGMIQKSQLNGSYGGGPDTFVAAEGKDVQSGLITSEPYNFQHTYKAWMKPVSSLLVYDSGYVNYASELAMIPSKVTKYSDCLKKFVPMAQKATADYLAGPTAMDSKIDGMNTKLKAPTQTTPGLDAYAVSTMKAKKLITNDANGTLGNFDPARMQKMIDILTPIFAKQGKSVKPGLAPADLYTNQFIDKSIGLAK